MDVVNNELFNELANYSGPNTVTMYMPTHPGTQDVRQDPIRLKNLINRAKELLEKNGAKHSQIQTILSPVMDLIDDIDFWQRPGSGVLLFLTEQFSRILKLELNLEELVVVNERFHLKRLITFLSENQRFYLLDVSKSRVRFLECTKFSCNRLKMDGIAESMEDAIGEEMSTKTLQLHTSGSRGGLPRGEAMYHGQGSMKDEELDQVTRYMKVLAKDIQNRLKDDKTPLLFAGDKQYFPIFQQSNSYSQLLDFFVEGNHDALSDHQLHEAALKTIEPYFKRSQEEAINRFKSIEGTMNVSEQIHTVAARAFEGRIETLILPLGLRQWGKFDASTGDVEIHTEQMPGDEDLFDFAAVHTLKNGGKVFPVKPEEMPNDGKIAAILRF
jgi:hypothetical protein